MSAALGAFIAGLLVAETSQNHAIFLKSVRFGIFCRGVFCKPRDDDFVGNAGSDVAGDSRVGRGNDCHKDSDSIRTFAVPWVSPENGVSGWGIFGATLRIWIYHRGSRRLVGCLSASYANLIVSLVFVTILINAPILTHGHRLYYWVYHTLGGKWPRIFRQGDEQFTPGREELPLSDHIVICGYGRVGKYIGRALQMANIPFWLSIMIRRPWRRLKQKASR